MYFFDIRSLIDDIGGPRSAANTVGKVRGAIYGWLKRGKVGSDDLALLKGEFPDLDLNKYVKRTQRE